MSHIDALVGKLMETLKECGIQNNTIISLWGDHGYHLGEHGHWGKVTNYEDATRAPHLIVDPARKNKLQVGALTEFLDVYPTLCELAGLPIPAHVQGKSLVLLMRGETDKLHEAAISEMSPGAKKGVMGWTLRTPRYRYIEWRKAKLDGENPAFSGEVLASGFYDYEKDPIERENLVKQPEYAQSCKSNRRSSTTSSRTCRPVKSEPPNPRPAFSHSNQCSKPIPNPAKKIKNL